MGFHGSNLNSAETTKKTSLWTGGTRKGPLQVGSLCWVSLQNQNYLDEQRFMGSAFLVSVTFQHKEGKYCSNLHSRDGNYIYPKQEARGTGPSKDAGLAGSRAGFWVVISWPWKLKRVFLLSAWPVPLAKAGSGLLSHVPLGFF